MDKEKISIAICMGSSCYARGNGKNAEIIQRWLKKEGIEAKIEFSGTLCESLCREGPNLRIAEKLYKGVDPLALEDILEHELKGPK